MAWILERHRKNGMLKYYVRDIRDGRQVVIECPDDVDRAFAERMKVQYEARLALEKHGYDDSHSAPIDRLAILDTTAEI